MTLEVFVIYDKAAKNYMNPTFEQTKDIAIRNFKVAMNRKDLFLYMSPTDFTLYKIGEYDTETADMKCGAPEIVCDGIAVLEVKDGIQN